MEEHLPNSDFFVSDYCTAAIALFAYTHVSDEGGSPLYDFSNQSVDRAGEGPAEFCFEDVASQRVETVRKDTVLTDQ